MGKNEIYAAIIQLQKSVGLNAEPKFGQYGSKKIAHITPCTVVNGHFRSWKTGKEVKVGSGLVWPIYAGTMFRFPDGTQILLSRKANGELTLIHDISFNPTSMVLVEAK